MAYAPEKVLKTSLLSWPLPFHFSVRTTSRQTESYDIILVTTERELGDLNFSKRRWRLIATRRLRKVLFLLSKETVDITCEDDLIKLLTLIQLQFLPYWSKVLKSKILQEQLRFLIECFHMTSRRPCWCPKPVLWELSSFLMQTFSFVPINLHRCWPREWKHFLRSLR